MAETIVSAPEVPVGQTSPKKTTAKKTGGKPANKPTHPPTSEMVLAAIAALKDKKGASLQAIKKYITTNYQYDSEKQAHFIKKFIKSAVIKKTIVQTKGVGAAGRFKLGVQPNEAKPVKKVTKKPTGETKVTIKKSAEGAKKITVKKTTVKKPADAKKDTTVKPKTVKLAKSPSKAKKSGKAPAAIKTPKPKKVAAAKKVVKK